MTEQQALPGVEPDPRKPYTVILLYPDHVADEYGENSCWPAMGRNVTEAVADARRQCNDANELQGHDEDEDDYCNPDDYAVVAVFEGHLQDLRHEVQS